MLLFLQTTDLYLQFFKLLVHTGQPQSQRTRITEARILRWTCTIGTDERGRRRQAKHLTGRLEVKRIVDVTSTHGHRTRSRSSHRSTRSQRSHRSTRSRSSHRSTRGTRSQRSHRSTRTRSQRSTRSRSSHWSTRRTHQPLPLARLPFLLVVLVNETLASREAVQRLPSVLPRSSFFISALPLHQVLGTTQRLPYDGDHAILCRIVGRYTILTTGRSTDAQTSSLLALLGRLRRRHAWMYAWWRD